MRRLYLLAPLLFAFSACGGSVPETPAAVTDALAGVSSSVTEGNPFALEVEAFELSEALMTFSHDAPVQMAADLNQLGREVAAWGATSGAAELVDPTEWQDLRRRIERVLAGDSPTEGPRYSSSIPEEVVAAAQAVDAALAAGDHRGAVEGLYQMSGATWSWTDTAPPAIAQKVYELAQELEMLSFNAESLSLEAISSRWPPLRDRINFEH